MSIFHQNSTTVCFDLTH